MKNPFKSKTLWLNVAGIALGVAAKAGYPVVPMDPTLVGLILAGANMVLRTQTSQPIGFQPSEQ